MKSIFEKRLFIFIALAVFVYIVLRAIYLPLYVDELYSFNHYVRSGFLSPFNDYRAANNHLLNTFFTTISYSLFGDSPLSIRLFNVLSFIPFSIYIYKIGANIKNLLPRWVFYLVLLLSLNFVSYFSLSRGYGLSFAFLMMSVYYTYSSFSKKDIRNVIYSVVCMLLALYANFSLLLFVLISLGILGINILKNKDYYFTKSNLIKLALAFVLVIVSIGFALKVLFFYKEIGELWWGSLDGFWIVTIGSLINFLFRSEDTYFVYQGGIIALMIIMGGIYFIKGSWLEKYNKSNLFFIFLFLNITGIILMANFFEVNYPFQRTGLHLYIFFLAAYCFGVDKINMKSLKIVLLLPLLYIPFHFSANMNLSYVSCWEEDNIPDSFYEKAKEIERNNDNSYASSIYIEGTTGSCWAYKVDNDNSRLPNSIVVREGTKKYYDYLIDRRENVAPFRHLYDSLDKQPSSEVCLYKRKQAVKRSLIVESKDSSVREVNSEFNDLIRITLDSLDSPSLFFDVKASLEYPEYPFQGNIMLSIVNKRTNETVGYKSIRLDMKGIWHKEDILRHGEFLNDLPVNDELEVVVYVWNLRNKDYKLHNTEVKIYSVIE